MYLIFEMLTAVERVENTIVKFWRQIISTKYDGMQISSTINQIVLEKKLDRVYTDWTMSAKYGDAPQNKNKTRDTKSFHIHTASKNKQP